MTSATVSLFASVAIAAVGAAGFAYTLSHPGVLVSVTNSVLAQAGMAPLGRTKAAEEPVLDAQMGPATNSGTGPGTISIEAGDYGHFQTEAEINGRAVGVMVDTGASLVALTYEDAANLGIFVNAGAFTGIAKTANGTARVAPITISRISIGDITVRNVPAVVSERGASERTLLGMSFLGRLSRVEMRGRTLVLQE